MRSKPSLAMEKLPPNRSARCPLHRPANRANPPRNALLRNHRRPRSTHPTRKQMKCPTLILIALLLFVTSLQAADTLSEFAIRSSDLQKAALVSYLGKHQTFELTLTREKSAEFNAFTKRNLKKQVVISLNGQSIASPVIMEPINGEMMSFQAGKDLQKYYDLLDQVASFKETKAP